MQRIAKLLKRKPANKASVVSKSLMKLQNERRYAKSVGKPLSNVIRKAINNMRQYNIHPGTKFYPLYNNFIKKTKGEQTNFNRNVKTLMNQTQNEININFKYSLPYFPR